MTNTLSQQEINQVFKKIENLLKSARKIKIEKTADRFEASYRIGRENAYLYAKKKIQCSGFDQNSQIEMRVSSMCSAVTLTKGHISEIDDTVMKAVNLFYLAMKEARERHKAENINKVTQKKLYKALKVKKVKYDYFANTKLGKVKLYVNVEKNATDIRISIDEMSLEQANKLIQLIS